MGVATGALPSLRSKFGELLVGEYNLQKGVKGEIRFVEAELESMHGALVEISKAPADQLQNHDRIWARDVRELSYDIEDSIDTFMVRGLGKGIEPTGPYGFKNFIDRCFDLLTQFQIRRNVATELRDIKRRVIEVCGRRDRYKIDNDVAKPVKIDPRLLHHFTKATELVGLDEARDEIIKILIEGDEVSMQQGKIVSIVGFGGLGKTTLANAVFEKISAQFDRRAFVSVSQTPDMKRLFKGMLYELGKNIDEETMDDRRLINELRKFLQEKRCFIVIDDIWDLSVWETIRCALPDNNSGYRIITTTRILKVAEQAGGLYKLKPLCLRSSRILLYTRIFGNEDKDGCPDEEVAEVSDKILKKCAGVPLAIITIASLLASKGRNKLDWYKVYKSIGAGLQNCQDLANMRKILSLSYYDLPSHLRTCILYLSVFPEDHKIDKDRLIWLWIAEGFIQCGEQGKSRFEVGESYFNELINRSLIQPLNDINGEHCRVHDMVLDLICSLSSEENFVTILNDVDHTSPSTKARRLSLQNMSTYPTWKLDEATSWATMSTQQVRSIVVFQKYFNLTQGLQSFRVLRVLDLLNCDVHADICKDLGNLFQLRYLGISLTPIGGLPEEIGSLRFLQTLEVKRTSICSLPSTVLQLRHLMCLRIPMERVQNGIDGLTSLEELSTLYIHDDPTDTLEELGHLTELRVLDIAFLIEWNDGLAKTLVQSLRKLQKIQSLIYLGIWSMQLGWLGRPSTCP